LGKLHNDSLIGLSLVKATTFATSPPLLVNIFRQDSWRGLAKVSLYQTGLWLGRREPRRARTNPGCGAAGRPSRARQYA
jgi:hypothetical protein